MKMTNKLIQVSLLVLSMEIIVLAKTQPPTSDLKELIKTEEEIIKSMRNYVKAEKKRIDFLDKYLARSKLEYEIAIKDVPYYFGNPINAYTIIKRLGPDLEFVEEVLRNKTELKTPAVPFPTEEDLMNAALGLSTVMDLYQLNISQVANGVMNITHGPSGEVFTEITSPMTASDCYSIGTFLFLKKRFREAVSWLEEAFKKVDGIQCVICPVSVVDVIDYICKALYELGEKTKYIEWARKRIALKPDDSESLVYEKHIRVLRSQIRDNIQDKKQKQEHPTCLGTNNNNSRNSKRLSCRYAHGPHPVFTLGPLKVERLHSDPDLDVFYDVLSDGDVEAIKTIIKSRKNSTRHDLDVFHNAEFFAVEDEASVAVARASRRAEELSGLTRVDTESLNVINFGIGRFGRPRHLDSKSKAMNKPGATQNISATVLFYLSDVELGGATVFPLLNLTVFPKKRAALLFLNELPSGETDLLLENLGCPVLRGNKWVAVNQQTNMSGCRVWKTNKGIVTHKMYKKILKDRQKRKNKYELRTKITPKRVRRH